MKAQAAQKAAEAKQDTLLRDDILPGLDGKLLSSQSLDRAGYLDAMDMYDGLFSRCDPILTFEAGYSISYDDDIPSVYTLALKISA